MAWLALLQFAIYVVINGTKRFEGNTPTQTVPEVLKYFLWLIGPKIQDDEGQCV